MVIDSLKINVWILNKNVKDEFCVGVLSNVNLNKVMIDCRLEV